MHKSQYKRVGKRRSLKCSQLEKRVYRTTIVAFLCRWVGPVRVKKARRRYHCRARSQKCKAKKQVKNQSVEKR